MPLPVSLPLLLSLPVLADDDGPVQRALEPEGDWVGGVAPVPAPPPSCGAIVRIQVPWEICDDGARDASDAPRRSYDGVVEAPHAGVSCGLTCTPAQDVGSRQWPDRAGWFFRIPPGVDAATLTCTLADDTTQTIALQPPGAPVPVGVGAWWLTSLETVRFSVGMAPDSDISLMGDNLCPAGQPDREGGVVGAMRP